MQEWRSLVDICDDISNPNIKRYKKRRTRAMIVRKLSGQTSQGPIELLQEDLLSYSGSVVILGEAGIGKTELTYWIGAQENFLRCTARQLISRTKAIELPSVC